MCQIIINIKNTNHSPNYDRSVAWIYIRQFWFMIGGLGCSLALNIALIFDQSTPHESPEVESADVDLSEIPSDEEMIAQAQQDITEDVDRSQSLEDIQSEWKILRTSVSHSLSRTFVNANPQHGSALSAVFSRLFMWDLDMSEI